MAEPASHLKKTRWLLALVVVALGCAAALSSPNVRRHLFRSTDVRTSVGGTFGSLAFESSGDTLNANGSLMLEQTNGAYQPTARITSDVVASAHGFNAVGVRWHVDTPSGTTAQLQVRLGDKDTWTDWRTLEPSDDQQAKDDPAAKVSDLIFVPHGDSVQLAADLTTSDGTRSPAISNVRVDFVDTTAGPTAQAAAAASISAASATSSAPPVISRAQWGADESWMSWPPQTAPVQKIIIHHTAGTDGGNDPAAVIRGIYYYHAVTLGWGDIGYNFVVDPAGRIYEGRAGGLGVVGGHTSGFNTGSVGIALLGNYESTPATPAMDQAAANLAGYLSAKFDLDPTAAVPFQGTTNPTIAAHRDYTQTLCNGTAEYAHLPAIRQAAVGAKAGYLGGQYAGAVDGVSGNILEPKKAGTATVTFRNTGSATWVNSGDNATVLATFAPEQHASSLATSGWASPSEVGVMAEASVGPGGAATFKVPLAAAGLGDTADTFAVARRGVGLVTGTGMTLVRSVRPSLRGSLDPIADPVTVEGGTRSVVEVTLHNTGARTWSAGGANTSGLNLTKPKGRTSVFRDPSWPLAFRPLTVPSDVPPDGTVTLRIPLRVPASEGDHREAMQLVVDKVGWVSGTEFTLHLVTTNPFQSELRERPIIVYATPGQTLNVAVNLRNRSGATWQPSGAGFVALEGVNLGPTGSTFKVNGWTSPIRPLAVPYPVDPKQAVGLSFPVKAPNGLGVYHESFHLVSDGGAAIDGSTFTLSVHVRQAYVAKVLEVRQPDPVTVGSTARATVRIQNLGAAPWRSDATNHVSVITANPAKHDSVLATTTWLDPGTPTQLEPPVVGPDQVATLSIELSAASVGSASDSFTLADPNGAAVASAGFTLTRTATPGSSTAGPSGPLGPNLRVGIVGTANGFPVSAAGAFTVKDSTGKTLGSAASGQVQVTFSGSTYSVSGAVSGSSTSPIRVEPATTDVVMTLPSYSDHPSWNPSLNDNTFRGTIEARRGSDGQVWAIDELPLELYLRGIAEASNGDNATYLQVMAVAERTYAEYVRSIGGKHATLGFDVDNVNDQVYKGYGFEQRSPDIAAAVDATKGLMVTYGGQVVVTPYFSQSDGRTRSWDEVWGAPGKAWLVSVPVPENAGKALLGHGVGLDASAARARAVAGQGRDQVLKEFYSGVSVDKRY